MIRFRTWLCAASAALGLTLGYGVQAQTNITIKLPSGSSCSFNGSTLDCSGGSSGTASCSISGKSSAVTGDTVTLTGSCLTAAGAADTMTWGGCGQATGSTCTLTSSATITLTGGTGGSASKTVTFGQATCSISPQNPTIQSGSSQTFSANCNFTPTSYSWTGACTGSSATCTVTPTAAGTVNLTASNGASSDSSSTAFTVSTGGGSGAIPATCQDGKASVTGKTINDFSGNAQTVRMSNSQVAVIPITVPQGLAKFAVNLTEWGDATDATPRNVWLSRTACSNVATSVPYNVTVAEGMIGANLKGAANWNFFVGSSSNVHYNPLGGIDVNVQPGDTWYLMVEWNAIPGKKSSGCQATSCQLQYTAPALN